MAHPQHTPTFASLEEAITVLFCLVDDTYTLLNPGWQSHESLKRLSDSEVLTLALFQQLRGVESERSFLRDAQRFFSHLFPGIAGLHPSSLHRRVGEDERFFVPLRPPATPREVGIVRRIRGEAAPHLLDQPRAHLLRAERGQRRGRALGAGAFGRSRSR